MDPQLDIYNITDAATPALVARGLVSQTLEIGGGLVPPGSSCKVPDSVALRASLQHLVDVGAVAIGQPPEGYRASSPAPARKPDPAPAAEPVAAAPVVAEETVPVAVPETTGKESRRSRRDG
jgi:hypothetical protein